MALPREQLGARIGAVVGALGGLVFVLVNAPSAGDDRALLLRLAGIGVFVTAVVEVTRARQLGSGREPGAAQMRAYWWIVIAEVVAIPVGANLLTRVLDVDNAGLPWVATVVGLHFVGFARIFPGAGFLALGVVTAGLGLVGLGLAVGGASYDTVAVLSGVVTGFVLMMAVIRGVHLGGSEPATTTV